MGYQHIIYSCRQFMAVLDSADLIPLWRVDRILHNGRDVLILPARARTTQNFLLWSLGDAREGKVMNQNRAEEKFDRSGCICSTMEC